MSWNGKDTLGARVIELGFEIESQGRVVPGVYWRPVGSVDDRLVLLGHGGSADKKAEYITQVAQQLCAVGIAAMAIDGPGHGERPSAAAFRNVLPADFEKRWNADGGTAGVVADWSAALDFIVASEGSRRIGWWGLSMGTMMGLPVCVGDDRVRVGVLGLMGNWGPNANDLERLAPELSIPVRFLVQWDDEVVPRDACLTLFDLLGGTKKTLHANPGLHAAVPAFEIAASVAYLDAQLSKIS